MVKEVRTTLITVTAIILTKESVNRILPVVKMIFNPLVAYKIVDSISYLI